MKNIKKDKQFTKFRGIGFKNLSILAASQTPEFLNGIKNQDLTPVDDTSSQTIKVIDGTENQDLTPVDDTSSQTIKVIDGTKNQDLKVSNNLPANIPKASLIPSYEPITHIDMTNRNSIDTFVKYFYYFVSKKFNLQFDATHIYFLWNIMELFFRRNPELIGYVEFHPFMASSFTRNYALHKKTIEKQLKLNQYSVSFFGGQKMDIRSFATVLEQKLEPLYKEFWALLHQVTISNSVKHKYHTLHLHSLWFGDITEIAEFGDGHNKSTGPSVLFFLDASTKYVVHHKVYPSKLSVMLTGVKLTKRQSHVDSKEIVRQVRIARDIHNIQGPVILHTDSENKNKSAELYLEFFQEGIIPSVNRTVYSTVDMYHENQVLENFNLHFKQKAQFVIKQEGYTIGSLLHESFSKKVYLIEKSIELHHNTEYATLSTKCISTKNYIPITPNSAWESHTIFDIIYAYYIALKNDSSMIPPKCKLTLKGLDLESKPDQTTFCGVVANYVFTAYFNRKDFDSLYFLLELKNGKINASAYAFVNEVIRIYIAYAVANCSNKRLRDFMHPNFTTTQFGVRGPGRKREYTKEFNQILQTKEDFHKFIPIWHDLFKGVILSLHTIYSQFQSSNVVAQSTQLIFAKTDQQTDVLKQHITAQNDSTKLVIRELKTKVRDLESKLTIFYNQQALKQQAKFKRQNRQKRPLTPAISLGHFMTALNFTKNQSSQFNAVSKQFSAARNRLALFLLYCSGIRINMLSHITISDLISIFKDLNPISIPVSKTRDKKKEQTIAIGEGAKDKFLYGEHNLYSDFKLIVNTFDAWAKQKNITSNECYSHCFFASYKDLSKSCSREALNKTINNIIRDAASQAGMPHKQVITFSSHSFRVQFITHSIDRFGIRKTQQYLKHENISNTARYDRGAFAVKSIASLTDSLCCNKKPIKSHPDVQQFTPEQLQLFANMFADQQNIPQITSNQDPKITDLISSYLPPVQPNVDFFSDKFNQIEQESHELELKRKAQLDQITIDTGAVEKSKRHRQHVKNAKKTS